MTSIGSAASELRIMAAAGAGMVPGKLLTAVEMYPPIAVISKRDSWVVQERW
jgi:hypothetical protein